MPISARIIADSKNQFSDRITSMVLVLPRFVLAEFNTHRMFSRNSASSRAVPFEKMLKQVEENPFVPIAWQHEHKGMQGTEYLDESNSFGCNETWKAASEYAIAQAKILSNRYEATKQLINRLLEPFMWHTCIVTFTESENFFKLRCPQYEITVPFTETISVFRSRKDAIRTAGQQALGRPFADWPDEMWFKYNKGQAEIHIMALAEAMWDAMNESTPKELKEGEWHIPFGDSIDEERLYRLYDKRENLPQIDNSLPARDNIKIKIATARCARVSYINYEGKDDYEADIRLYETLLKNGHASPLEHCAVAMGERNYSSWGRRVVTDTDSKDERGPNGFIQSSIYESGWCRNFKGFISLRALLGQ